MNPIIPHLWFDIQAKEAVELYTSLIPNSKIKKVTTIHEVPSPTGDCDVVSFELNGQPFMAINAGPYFKPNPSISFFINFDPSKDSNAEENLKKTWEKFAQGGKVLMELNKYPFSQLYGWVEDKYGVSWQLILTDPKGNPRPMIVPSMLFVQDMAGRAEEAIKFYTSVFSREAGSGSAGRGSQTGLLARYPAGMEPDKEGTIMFGDFKINDTWIAAMDSAHDHKFKFNEGISLIIPCDTQEEMDYFTEKLSVVPEAEQCGWVKDKFGVSWQIVAKFIDEVFESGDEEKIARLNKVLQPMKRINLEELKRAAEGK